MENNDINPVWNWEFIYEGKSTIDNLTVAVCDIRDLIFAFSIPDEQQRIEEINTILRCVERRNRLKTGSLQVRKVCGILDENTFLTATSKKCL